VCSIRVSRLKRAQDVSRAPPEDQFATRQHDVLSAGGDKPTTGGVENPAVESNDLYPPVLASPNRFRPRLSPSRNAFDARQDLAQVKGLGYIIVRANLKTDHAIEHLVPARQHDDSDVGFGVNFAGDRQPVLPRQDDVEEDDVNRPRLRCARIAAPSLAALTRYPSCSKHRVNIWRIRGSSSTTRMCRGCSAELIIDAPQLQNALLNLVINARDPMPNGGRLTIEISHARLDADYAQAYAEVRTERYVLIAVTDTGEGMSEDVRQRAFEPFFTTKPTGAGTGLGLSLVYGFVKQSGGNIQLDSELDRGTTVRVFLPLAEAVRSATEPARGKANGDVMPGGSEAILLVEDDPRLRRVASRRLRSLGYRVIEADNGANALTQLAAHAEIAIIFTDFVMPGGMNGNELAEAALAANPAVKILFTSGYAEPAARGKLRAGAWLRKPYTATELARRIRDVLREPPT
jgi:CheY-like chemotaxis protein